MYCHHCAKHINEHKLESKSSSFSLATQVSDQTKIEYVCPRCGHLVHDNLSPKEIKELSQASHAQLQRSRNYFASGMGSLSIGAIILVTAVLFFLLARKPANQYQITLCTELFVSIALFAISVCLVVFGAVFVSISIKKKNEYKTLLRDINNNTFVQ